MITPQGVLLLAEASDPWADWFFGLDDVEKFAFLIVFIGCATGIFFGIAGMIYSAVGSIHRRRTDAALKHELIERGFSADEIAKIVESGSPPEVRRRAAT